MSRVDLDAIEARRASHDLTIVDFDALVAALREAQRRLDTARAACDEWDPKDNPREFVRALRRALTA